MCIRDRREVARTGLAISFGLELATTRPLNLVLAALLFDGAVSWITLHRVHFGTPGSPIQGRGTGATSAPDQEIDLAAFVSTLPLGPFRQGSVNGLWNENGLF